MVEFMTEPLKIQIDLGDKNRELMNASRAWSPTVIEALNIKSHGICVRQAGKRRSE
jgi:hypothetical protein